MLTLATVSLLRFQLKKSNAIVNAKYIELTTLVTKGADDFRRLLILNGNLTLFLRSKYWYGNVLIPYIYEVHVVKDEIRR